MILGVFLRDPVPGKVKKRLARDVGADEACRLYVEFVRQTISIVRASGIHAIYFCSPPGSAARIRRLFRIRARILPQSGKTLGDKMRNAFRQLLSESRAALLIGTDSPTLPVRILKCAATNLKAREAVLGPAEDGGYYLIGLTRDAFAAVGREIFSRIKWGGSNVYSSTADRLRRLGVRFHRLPVWYDIDTARDLNRARRLLTDLSKRS